MLKAAITCAVAALALAAPASAQTYPAGTRGFVRGIDQPTRRSVRRADRRYKRLPARDRNVGQVAPPSAISPGIRIIAPAR